MNGSIQVVLFDFGGVVAPMADDAITAPLEQELGLAAGALQPLLYDCEGWHDLSTGKLQEDEYWRRLAAAVKREPQSLRAMLRAVWEPARVDEEVVALVRAIKPLVRTSLLSNATLNLESQLATLGIADLFDPIINSARVGLRKPDPAVFRYALDVLGTPAGAVLFVDDKERNTLVAEELGIPSVVFRSAPDLAAALRVCGVLA